jgi:hypothetical protein
VYRPLPFQERSQHVIGTHVSGLPLRYQSDRELVYRPLQFQKRGQQFVGRHDETLSVAMCVHNPNRLSH